MFSSVEIVKLFVPEALQDASGTKLWEDDSIMSVGAPCDPLDRFLLGTKWSFTVMKEAFDKKASRSPLEMENFWQSTHVVRLSTWKSSAMCTLLARTLTLKDTTSREDDIRWRHTWNLFRVLSQQQLLTWPKNILRHRHGYVWISDETWVLNSWNAFSRNLFEHINLVLIISSRAILLFHTYA